MRYFASSNCLVRRAKKHSLIPSHDHHSSFSPLPPVASARVIHKELALGAAAVPNVGYEPAAGQQTPQLLEMASALLRNCHAEMAEGRGMIFIVDSRAQCCLMV